MSVSYLLCAAHVVQDSVTSNLSYINIFDSILLPRNMEPFYQDFSVAGQFSEGVAGRHMVAIDIIDPMNQPIARVSFEITIPMTGSAPFWASFVNLKLQKVGRYHIRVLVDTVPVESTAFYFDTVRLPENYVDDINKRLVN